jgi:hypothetical protein
MPDTPSPLFPADNPAVTTHINLLQGIINRLANNSAACKTWCLTLVAALLSLAGATHSPAIVTFALVPVAIFGFVDTMYLAQEKAYRDLYELTVSALQHRSYTIASTYNAKADLTFGNICSALTSWAIWPVYGGLIAAYLEAARHGWLELLATAAKS